MKGWVWMKGEPDEEHICISCFIVQKMDAEEDFLTRPIKEETQQLLHAIIYGGERIVEASMDTYDSRLLFEEFDSCTHCCAGVPCMTCGKALPDHEEGCSSAH